jgi:hypothetical protein
MTAKMVSKPYRKDSRADWEEVRVQIMRWCLRVKLAQHWESFGDLLLSTGDWPIVEESRRDTFWGAKSTNTGTLIGRNVLGQLLTELREQLKSSHLDELRIIEPPALPQFFLIEKPIGVIEDSSSKPGGVPEVYEHLKLDGVVTSETISPVEPEGAVVEELSDVIQTPPSPIQCQRATTQLALPLGGTGEVLTLQKSSTTTCRKKPS